jgi:hypothetical protein
MQGLSSLPALTSLDLRKCYNMTADCVQALCNIVHRRLLPAHRSITLFTQGDIRVLSAICYTIFIRHSTCSAIYSFLMECAPSLTVLARLLAHETVVVEHLVHEAAG